MKMNKWILICWLAVVVVAKTGVAQDVKHPDMETIFNDEGNDVVVVTTTQQPPDPKFYVIKEETGGKGSILVVYYKPTGEMVVFFSKTTIKGKSEGPGVSIASNRVAPQIEKVIGQKSYDRDIKKRYLEDFLIDKSSLIGGELINLKEVDLLIKKRRN